MNGWTSVGRESRREFSHEALPHALLREVSWQGQTVWRLWLASAQGDLGLAARLPMPSPLWLDLAQHRSLDASACAELPDWTVWILHLTATATDDRALPHLARLAELRELCLSGCPVANLAPLAGLSRLTRLRLAGVVDPRGLGSLSSLRSLDLGRARLQEPVWRGLALERLGLARASFPLNDLPAGLRALDLSGTAIPSLDALAPLEELEELALGGLALRDWSVLGSLSRLSVLDLSGSDVSGDDLRPWASLTELDLASTAVGDSCIEALLGCPRLARLNLSRCPVTGEGALRLAEHRGLRQLDLFGCPGVNEGAVQRLREAGKRVEWFV